MRRFIASLAAVAVVAVVHAVPSSAGPDKIKFPAEYKDGVLYGTVDRHDNKQYRELWGTADAVTALKAGRPLPSGSVLTLIQYKAQVDTAGNPIKGPSGKFVKGDLIAYTVMEKRTGWGAEYPEAWRNGEWEYAAFGADGKLNEKANYKGCFECHKPHAKTDFVISQAQAMLAAAPTNFGAAPAMPPAALIDIDGFKFGPAKLQVQKGMPIRWTNKDESPHQITVTTGTTTRSAVLTKGQAHTQAFGDPGTYDSLCGLHPTMKGQIEVK
jgi:plastocyanin